MVRYLRIWACAASIALALWWAFFSQINNSGYHEIYTQDDFKQDISLLHFNLGKFAEIRADHERAIIEYQRALEIDPENLASYRRLGKELELTNQPHEALKMYFKALCINPHFYAADQCSGVTEPSPHPELSTLKQAKKWSGQDLLGKRIYVYAEKNSADTIFFCRFIPHLVDRGAQVFFKPQRELYHLFLSNNLKAEIIDEQVNLSLVTIDYHCSLLALPHYLGLESYRQTQASAYLTIPQERLTRIRNTGRESSTLKIGIVFQSEKDKTTLPSALATALKTISGATLYSLDQNADEKTSYPFIINLVSPSTTAVELATIIERLDAVIAVDSFVAHLAGALGKKTFLIIHDKADWCWLTHARNEAITWYESLTIIHHAMHDSWRKPLTMITAHLKKEWPATHRPETNFTHS